MMVVGFGGFYLVDLLWSIFNRNILDMDYVNIENPETHRAYDRIKTFIAKYDHFDGDGVYLEILNKIIDASRGITYAAASLAVTWELYAQAGSVRANVLTCTVLVLVVTILVLQNVFRSKSIFRQESIDMSPETVKPNRIRNYFLDNYCGEYQAAKDIHIYRHRNLILKRTDELFSQFDLSKRRGDRLKIRQKTADEVCDVVRSVLIYGLALAKALAGTITAGALVRDVQSFYRLQYGFNLTIESIAKLDGCMFPLRLIYDFLDMPDKKYHGSIPT